MRSERALKHAIVGVPMELISLFRRSFLATVMPSSVKHGTVQQGNRKSKFIHHAIRKLLLNMVNMRRKRNRTDSLEKRMVRI